MKRTLMAIAAAGIAMTLIPTEASAWICRADSPSAYGWGSHRSRARAVRIAIVQCAARTPRYQVCYLSWCR
jgi:hypothetical protein